ncbi:hypothetical protein HGA91_00610 [candidate division WWE3 bacterium]|nr:hypothetical protein [candidate division WWE3 bacterium]
MVPVSRIFLTGRLSRYRLDTRNGLFTVSVLGCDLTQTAPNQVIVGVWNPDSDEYVQATVEDLTQFQEEWRSFWAYVQTFRKFAQRPPVMMLSASALIRFLACGAISVNAFLNASEPPNDDTVWLMRVDLAALLPARDELRTVTVIVFSDRSNPLPNGRQWVLFDKKRQPLFEEDPRVDSTAVSAQTIVPAVN